MKRRVLVLGGLGYLGWSLGVGLSLSNEAEVILADNQSKRDWARRVGGAGLHADTPVSDRLAALNAFGGGSVTFVRADAHNYEDLSRAITSISPHVIVNCAHQPSAPYSELSPEAATLTLQNNVATHFNVLWCLKTLKRPVKYIELNSAGTLGEIEYVPPEKVGLTFSYNGLERQIAKAWLPMQANDVYHLSKAQNFMLSEMFASRFGLNITSVRQSVLFGIAPLARELPRAVLPPVYYDPIFGTVANRFVFQHAAGFAPTVYGDGSQSTGLIALRDAVEAIIRCCSTEGRPGDLEVLHNQTCVLAVKELAALVTRDARGHAPPIRDDVRLTRPLERRLERSPLGACAQTAEQLADALKAFRHETTRFVGEFQRDCLAAACPRRDY